MTAGDDVSGDAGPAAPPTCYRHSDRETYVRCTRCDRSICPDCMRDAAVGFHCPECVREGQKSVRQARTVFGGRVSSEALVTRVIIGICVLAFVLQNSSDSVTFDFADTAFRPIAGGGPDGVDIVGVATGEYYRLLTSAFLHADVLHIAFNMYVLYIYGSQVELALGRWRYITLYLLSALGGSALSYGLGSLSGLSLGASGAVFGLVGAYFVAARRVRADTSQIVFFIALNLGLGFLSDRIDNRAHIGGLVTGAALAYAWAHLRGMKAREALHVGVAVVVAVVVAAGVLVRTADIHDRCGDGSDLNRALVCLSSELQEGRD